MARFGLVSRVLFVLAASLVAFQLIALGIASLSLDPAEDRLALPAQVAAIVALAERSPADRAVLVQAVEGPETSIEFRPSLPEGEQVLPRFVSDLVQRYEPALAGRELHIIRHDPATPRAVSRWLFNARPYSIAVRMSDGDFLVVRARGRIPRRLAGLPVGIAAGWLGFVIAAVSLLLVWREIRPVGDLARASERFARTVEPQPLTPGGAPDLRRLIVAFNTMQRDIAALVESRTHILRSLSHDLRTFAARLRLRLEALPQGIPPAAIEDIRAMEALLENALELARPSPPDTERRPVDLVALAGLECQSAMILDRTIRFHAPGEGEVTVRGEPVAIRRAITNLVSNALRHGREVEVTVLSTDGFGIVRVDDDGPGIDERDRERIFEPFWRVETSRNRETGGAGLGLAIVRRVADDHGGTVRVGHAPMGGARFELRLPLMAA
ncbi:MAG: ATP-binding protein [Phreatobacter sp.]